MSSFLNLEELEALARERLEPGVFGYYAGGADDEVTLRGNREAFRRLRLLYRVLVDVSERDLTTALLGSHLSAPLILAPTALHRMAHPNGELATARAAARSGLLMTLSSITSVGLQDVAASAPGAPRWFQLYHMKDRGLTAELVRQAAAAGYRALVLTVDTPYLGRRERDLRPLFAIPEGVQAVHFHGAEPGPDGGSPIAHLICQPSLSWKDLDAIRALSSLPVLVKGIVRADDARRAVEEGIDGVWVSNHGGRQLDTAIPTAEALPAIADAVGGRVPIVVDGGVRRGTDVLKALAMGANAVAIGRPVLWGLALGGEEGVHAVLTRVLEELSLAMALAGCRALAEIDRSLVSS